MSDISDDFHEIDDQLQAWGAVAPGLSQPNITGDSLMQLRRGRRTLRLMSGTVGLVLVAWFAWPITLIQKADPLSELRAELDNAMVELEKLKLESVAVNRIDETVARRELSRQVAMNKALDEWLAGNR